MQGNDVWAGMQDSGVYYRVASNNWVWRNSGLIAVHVESLLGAASGTLLVGSSGVGISKSGNNGASWRSKLIRRDSFISDIIEDAGGNLYAGADGDLRATRNVIFKSN